MRATPDRPSVQNPTVLYDPATHSEGQLLSPKTDGLRECESCRRCSERGQNSLPRTRRDFVFAQSDVGLVSSLWDPVLAGSLAALRLDCATLGADRCLTGFGPVSAKANHLEPIPKPSGEAVIGLRAMSIPSAPARPCM